MHEYGIACRPRTDITWRLALNIGTRTVLDKRDDDTMIVYRQGKCECGSFSIAMAAILTPRWRTEIKLTRPEQLIDELRAVLQEFTEAYGTAADEGMAIDTSYYLKNTEWLTGPGS